MVFTNQMDECRMGPPSDVCWFRNTMKTIVIYVMLSIAISTINHIVKPLVSQLSYLGGPIL